MKTTSDALDAGLLRSPNGRVIGTGGFIDTPNQRLADPARLPIVTAEDLAQVPIDGRSGRRLCARRRRDRRPRAPAARSATRSSTTARPDAHRREVPVGEHARRDARASSDALDELRPGLPGHRDRLRRSSGRRTSSRSRSHNLTRGADPRLRCSSCSCWSLFLFEWRTALISLVAIPLSLMAAALVLDAARGDDQHDGARRVRDRRRRRRRRRDHRHREHRPTPAAAPRGGQRRSRPRRSSSTPRSRCAARSSTRR